MTESIKSAALAACRQSSMNNTDELASVKQPVHLNLAECQLEPRG